MNCKASAALLALLAVAASSAAPATTLTYHWRDPVVRAAFGSTANDCEGRRKPSVQRTDINRDGMPDAIVWDRAACYDSVGGYFALVTKREGQWVNIGYGTGRPSWLSSRTSGWPDFEARERHYGKACFRFYQFTNGRYLHNYLRETQPRHCRNQRHDHQPAR